MSNFGSRPGAILGAASILAIMLSPAAHAQTGNSASTPTETPSAAPVSPSSGIPSAAVPAPNMQAPAAPTSGSTTAVQMGDPIDTNLVDVSLGDWSLKNELASQLRVKVSQIPLTVAVSSSVASQVCPIGNDELDQQKVTSATRTCAAKQMTDELREEVRTQVRDTSAN